MVFSLNDNELQSYIKFIYAHTKCSNNKKIIVSFEHTGYESVVKIKCPVCGKEEDITDRYI